MNPPAQGSNHEPQAVAGACLKDDRGLGGIDVALGRRDREVVGARATGGCRCHLPARLHRPPAVGRAVWPVHPTPLRALASPLLGFGQPSACMQQETLPPAWPRPHPGRHPCPLDAPPRPVPLPVQVCPACLWARSPSPAQRTICCQFLLGMERLRKSVLCAARTTRVAAAAWWVGPAGAAGKWLLLAAWLPGWLQRKHLYY